MTGSEKRDSSFELKNRIKKVLSLSPYSVAITFKGHQITWGQLDQASKGIEDLLRQAGVQDSAPIGWAARNRPASIATCISLLAHGRMIVPLRPSFKVDNFREDIIEQRLQAVLGDTEDWAGEGVIEAAHSVGSVGIEIGSVDLSLRFLLGLEHPNKGPFRGPAGENVLERLTSGTTGKPKRIPVSRDILIPSLQSGVQGQEGKELVLQRSPALLFKPFSHAGGLFGLLLSLYQARPIVLFEKFSANEWIEAVKTHRPKSASLVPTMIRMVLDENPDPENLSSLLAIRSGTAPLEQEVQQEFEKRFGVPILIDYGAAEFIGGLAGWTLKEYKTYGKVKKGSVGRARRDVQIRVVDEEQFVDLQPGQIGLVEVRSTRYGPDWIRTNDLAFIDEDGFIFLQGRIDDAINRGGFKVLPDEVAAVLRQHPAVSDAAVVAKPDKRLGQVPIAAIELLQPDGTVDLAELDAMVRKKLPSYMVPVEYRVIKSLPRTLSMKVSRPELKTLLGF